MPKYTMVYSEVKPHPPRCTAADLNSAQPRLHPGTTAEHGGSRSSQP
ncbi:MAG: hypothetical protein K0S98_465 [Propionibacteriaceae bacterium]|nr:hypothetical protein [Propionibacteriaceae bacterium]